MRSIGVDLHTNSFLVCYQPERGRKKLEEFKLKDINRFKKSLRRSDKLALESTGNARWFTDQIRGKVEKVVVVNPGKFDVIRKSVKKTDSEDCKALAFFLSKGMLPEARMKNKEQAQLSSLIGTRDRLVKLRTSLMNKIHNIMNGHGIKMKKEVYGTEKGLRQVLEMGFDEMVQLELEVIVNQIRSLNEGIRKLDDEISSKGDDIYKGHKNLTSIKGIGKRSASILMSVIGDIDDFESESKLFSYFGIVPKVSCSNEKEHYGHITRRGSKIGRTTLVQCTLVAKRYSPYLHRFYEKVRRKRGTGKAIIATAKKFLGIIYNTLKNDWIFKDFPNFVFEKS